MTPPRIPEASPCKILFYRFLHSETNMPYGSSSVSSTESSILDGLDYECLILEESGKLGQFRRLGYFKFRPLRYTYSDMSDEQWLKHRIHARDLLRKQFVHDNLPGSVCGVPDQTGRYEITLI
jgi:hypothetical protein